MDNLIRNPLLEDDDETVSYGNGSNGSRNAGNVNRGRGKGVSYTSQSSLYGNPLLDDDGDDDGVVFSNRDSSTLTSINDSTNASGGSKGYVSDYSRESTHANNGSSVSNYYDEDEFDDEDSDEDDGFELPDLEWGFEEIEEVSPAPKVRTVQLVDPSGEDSDDLFSDPLVFSPNRTVSIADNIADLERYVPVIEVEESDGSDSGDSSYDEDGIDLDSLDETIEALARMTQLRASGGNAIEASPSNHMSSFDYDDDEEEDELRGFDLDLVIAKAIEVGASDIHISAHDEVAFTIFDEIFRAREFGMVLPEMTLKLGLSIISHVLESQFVQELELDTSYVVKTGPAAGRRLRLSMGRSHNSVMMVFRVVADVVPTPEELGVKGELLEWIKLPGGLVLINGGTGTGKSTTISSLIKREQLTSRRKILTVEKPIEFVYGTEGTALITQREVGIDTRSFTAALTSGMRQNPNVILIGEVRDRVEVDELLRAAETGHLAISTMHTDSAPTTVNRIKSLYKGDEQNRVLGTLADVSRGFANQVLVKTPDGKSRFAVREVLAITEDVSQLILHGDVQGLKKYMRGEKISMDHELARAVAGGYCLVEDARMKSSNPYRFDSILKEV